MTFSDDTHRAWRTAFGYRINPPAPQSDGASAIGWLFLLLSEAAGDAEWRGKWSTATDATRHDMSLDIVDDALGGYSPDGEYFGDRNYSVWRLVGDLTLWRLSDVPGGALSGNTTADAASDVRRALATYVTALAEIMIDYDWADKEDTLEQTI